MITKLYTFYDLPFDHDTCHLFEHVIIREFLLALREHGYNRAFFGWLHGRTIDSTIFFDLGAHNHETILLFESILQRSHSFNDKIVDQAINHIRAEMSAGIIIKDYTLLKEQLQSMIQPESTIENISPVNTLAIIEKPKLFREVAVIINIYDISKAAQKAFLCLYPSLLDIIRDAALDNVAAYPTGISPLATKDGGIGVAQRYMIAKTVDLENIKRSTERYLREYDTSSQSRNLEMYRNSFKNDAQYNAAPIQYYEETAIQTTREELATLATTDHLKELLNKMSIQIKPISGKLKSVEWL